MKKLQSPICVIFFCLLLVSCSTTTVTATPTPTVTPLPTLTPTGTPVPVTPTPKPYPTATVTSQHTPKGLSFGFSFDGTDVSGWNTSEGNYKQAICSIVSSPVYTGHGALAIDTKLAADSDIDSHTETKVDMDQSIGIPAGYSKIGPYDWEGKVVKVWVWVPKVLARKINIGIYVADQTWHNDRQVINNLPIEETDHWFLLSLIVGQGNYTDEGFSPRLIRAIGVRIDVTDSSLNFLGKFFIDNVVLPA